jgi:hypothetical protein
MHPLIYAIIFPLIFLGIFYLITVHKMKETLHDRINIIYKKGCPEEGVAPLGNWKN